jgi:copper transport protein
MYAGLTGLTGAAFFVLLLLRRLRALGLGSDLFAEDAATAARRVALISATVLVLATPGRLLCFALVNDVTVRAAIGTHFGRAWMLQFFGALVALVAVLVIRRMSGTGVGAVRRWRIAGLGAVAVAIGFSLSGHASDGSSFRLLEQTADVLHQIAAGAWIGTLASLTFAGIPAALRANEESRGTVAAALVRAFSPLALTSAGVLALTGSYAGWMRLGGLAPLFSSDYGRVLLIKLGVIALVMIFGALNWRYHGPRLGTEGAARTINRSALVELSLGLVVILVTAGLVAMATPID